MGKVTTRVDNRAGWASVYVDGEHIATMERAPYTGNWMYNASTADNFKPRMYPTGKTSTAAAARIAAKAALALRAASA